MILHCPPKPLYVAEKGLQRRAYREGPTEKGLQRSPYREGLYACMVSHENETSPLQSAVGGSVDLLGC